jgi:hypothetical protein
MTSSTDRDRVEANLEVDRAEATKNLPLLRAYRDKLEREAGELGAEAQRQQLVITGLGSVAAVAIVYSLYRQLTAEPPIVAWVISIVLALIAAGVARNRNSSKRERERHLAALHDKMHSIGRRIATAERRLGE